MFGDLGNLVWRVKLDNRTVLTNRGTRAMVSSFKEDGHEYDQELIMSWSAKQRPERGARGARCVGIYSRTLPRTH